MPLIELEEDHDLTQIKVAIQVVIKNAAEAIHREISCINSVPRAVIDEVSHTIKLILPQTLQEELAQVARIDRGKRLRTVVCQLGNQIVCCPHVIP